MLLALSLRSCMKPVVVNSTWLQGQKFLEKSVYKWSVLGKEHAEIFRKGNPK